MRISDWSSDVCSSDLAKVSILIHRDLALRQIDTMTPHQSLSPCKALIVHDAGKLLVPSAIGDAGRSAFSHVDLVAGSYRQRLRSEEHTSEIQSIMRISYDDFCLKKKQLNYITVQRNT